MELATELGRFEFCLCGCYNGSQGREIKDEQGIMTSLCERWKRVTHGACPDQNASQQMEGAISCSLALCIWSRVGLDDLPVGSEVRGDERGHDDLCRAVERCFSSHLEGMPTTST